MTQTYVDPDVQRLQQFLQDEITTSRQLYEENIQLRETLGDREERIAQLRAENSSNQATINAYHLREERRKEIWRNKDLIALEKQVAIVALEEIESKRIDITEPTTMCVEQIAARVGASPATVGKKFANLDKTGVLHYTIGATEYKDGSYYTPVTVAFTDLINSPGSIRKDPQDRQGGGREKKCLHCGSEDIDLYTVQYCRECRKAGWYGQVGLRHDANVLDAMRAAGRDDVQIHKSAWNAPENSEQSQPFHIVHHELYEKQPDITQNETILSCNSTIPEHDKMITPEEESEDTVCPIQIEQIAPPEELRRLHQWVPWRYEPSEKEGGKPKKVPYQTRGRGLTKASVSDRDTWSTCEKAIAFIEEARTWKEPVQFDGIGFMFDKDYTGIDFDHCLHDGVIDEQVWARVMGLWTYSEVSPSGTGVHCIAKGTVPCGRKRSDIEMYSERRFLTWTGNHIIDTPPTIEDRQQLLTDLHAEISPALPTPLPQTENRAATTHRVYKNGSDAETLEKARGAANGAEFRALFDEGRLSDYGNDHSRADLALCQRLAYWTNGDGMQIDRLFRKSRLMRPKWDKRARSGETYGEGTIRYALLYHGGVSA